jgi:hypothetical protein
MPVCMGTIHFMREVWGKPAISISYGSLPQKSMTELLPSLLAKIKGRKQ